MIYFWGVIKYYYFMSENKQNFSEIYCTGELLHDVQLMNLFKDSKTFVDFRLKYPADEIILKYKELKEKEHGLVNRGKLKEFVEENFERGDELESWVPSDWKRDPSLINKVTDVGYKKWVSDLNTLWRVLARRVKPDVKINPDRYSAIYLPNGFIIPGGRFTEMYYWDTYWIINGLLLCDMTVTAKGQIENLLHLVKLLGHVPNGSRTYYVSRSQPPLLIQMVNNFYKKTNDWKFIEDNLELLSKEFDYWWENHMLTIIKGDRNYKLARYFSFDPTPRPESYREDYIVAHDFTDKDDQADFYIKIRSAAETGWDFSSRWMVRNGTNQGSLADIAAPQIIPVDLNAFLQLNAEILGDWYNKVGNWVKSRDYKMKAELLLQGISKVLWSEEEGMWLDYDCVNGAAREYFYASNFAPLFTFSYPKSWSRTALSKRVISYMRLNNLEDFIGGTPVSIDETGEQWDFPNVWAPLQGIIIHGLDRLGTDDATEEAHRMADKFLQAVYKGYKTGLTMFEKYDAIRPGQSGEGGEYTPQTGFGWTNGVVLELLERYGRELEITEGDEAVEHVMRKNHKSFRVSNMGFVDISKRKSFTEFYRSMSVVTAQADPSSTVFDKDSEASKSTANVVDSEESSQNTVSQ